MSLLKRVSQWLRWQWQRLNGYGSCWTCGKTARLSWVKEHYRDEKKDRTLDFKAWLCNECWKARMHSWDASFTKFRDEMLKEFREGDKP